MNLSTPANYLPQVLILDDDSAFRTLFKELLEREGIVTRATGSEAEAFEMMQGPEVLVLIQDFNREPGTMRGCKFTAALRENPETKFTPVILITDTQKCVIEKAFRETGLDWNREITALIPKPHSQDEASEIATVIRFLIEIEV